MRQEDCYIDTGERFSSSFFKPYINAGVWVEANELYGDGITSITKKNEAFHKHFINHIEHYDLKLKKFIVYLFKNLSISPKDFRCDFFLTKEGGFLPEHIDGKSLMAILIPLSKNTGDLILNGNTANEIRLCYQSMLILNTQIPHQVCPPQEDRLMFRIGLHDTPFKEIDRIGSWAKLRNLTVGIQK